MLENKDMQRLCSNLFLHFLLCGEGVDITPEREERASALGMKPADGAKAAADARQAARMVALIISVLRFRNA